MRPGAGDKGEEEKKSSMRAASHLRGAVPGAVLPFTLLLLLLLRKRKHTNRIRLAANERLYKLIKVVEFLSVYHLAIGPIRSLMLLRGLGGRWRGRCGIQAEISWKGFGEHPEVLQLIGSHSRRLHRDQLLPAVY